MLYGNRQFGKTDGRTKTGYKDNVVPNKLRALVDVLIGGLRALLGIGGLVSL